MWTKEDCPIPSLGGVETKGDNMAGKRIVLHYASFELRGRLVSLGSNALRHTK